MITEDKVIEIFYMADEYSREFSKVMVILILFPVLSSYSCFVELEKEVALCLALVVKGVLLGKCTGIISTTASRSGTSATCRTSGASSAGTGDMAPLFQQLHCQHSLGYRCLFTFSSPKSYRWTSHLSITDNRS